MAGLVLLLCCSQQARSTGASAPVSGPGGPARGHWRTAATTHQPARRPAASGAMLGITYRDEQTCAKRFEPLPADSALEDCRGASVAHDAHINYYRVVD